MGDLVWIKHEFPWLGSGFVHAIADEHVDGFAEDLSRLGFSTVTVMGDAVVDDATFWLEIKRRSAFPTTSGPTGMPSMTASAT